MAHRVGNKRRPQPHQHAGNNASRDAFLRRRTRHPGETPISLAVHDHRNNRASHSHREQTRIPFGLLQVTGDHPHHQRNPNRNRKSNRQPRHVNRRHQQQVRQIKNRPADKRVNNVRAVRRSHVFQKTRRIIRSASHRERQHHRHQKNPHRIIPVKKLEPVILHALERVRPGAPTNSRSNHHYQRNFQTMRRVHSLAAPSSNIFPAPACPNNLVSSFARSCLYAPPSTMSSRISGFTCSRAACCAPSPEHVSVPLFFYYVLFSSLCPLRPLC